MLGRIAHFLGIQVRESSRFRGALPPVTRRWTPTPVFYAHGPRSPCKAIPQGSEPLRREGSESRDEVTWLLFCRSNYLTCELATPDTARRLTQTRRYRCCQSINPLADGYCSTQLTTGRHLVINGISIGSAGASERFGKWRGGVQICTNLIQSCS